MRRSRITITVQQETLNKIDHYIDGEKIRNRSHAIELILNEYLQPKIDTAVILAGGQGTKLRPYTYEIPKSLLPIQGKPLLEYTIYNLKRSNIKNVIICIGYLGKKIKDYFGNGSKYGLHITYSEETKPLQTGGALLKIKHLVQNMPFLVIHGDIVTNFDLRDLITFHNENKSTGTIALTPTAYPTDFGQLTLHGIKLINFYQRTKKKEIKSNLINCGIYIFEPEIFSFFEKSTDHSLLENIIGQLIEEKKINGFVFEEQWFDVGNPENYERAIKNFKISPYLNQKLTEQA